MRVRKPRDSMLYSGIFHSGGTRPGRPARRPTVLMFSRMRRRAPITASAASGSSTHSAISTLTRKSLVRRSRVTSNQASQHSRVASTTRQMMTSWRCRQPAHAVIANVTSRPRSNPTHAPRQPPER